MAVPSLSTIANNALRDLDEAMRWNPDSATPHKERLVKVIAALEEFRDAVAPKPMNKCPECGSAFAHPDLHWDMGGHRFCSPDCMFAAMIESKMATAKDPQ